MWISLYSLIYENRIAIETDYYSQKSLSDNIKMSAKLEKKIDELLAKFDKMDSSVSAVHKEINNIKEEMNKRDKKNDKKLKTIDKKIELLSECISTIHKDISTLKGQSQRQYQHLDETIKETVQKFKPLKSSEDYMSKCFKDQRKDIKDINLKQKNLENENKHLNSELHMMKNS